MDNLLGTVAAFEYALRQAEIRHKVHLDRLPTEDARKADDWVPFYAQHLAREFAGVRVPLPIIATVKGKMELSNRKWEPTDIVNHGPGWYAEAADIDAKAKQCCYGE